MQLEGIFDHLNTGILLVDEHYCIQFANEWMEVYHGAPLPEGAKLDDVFEMTEHEYQKLKRKVRTVLTLKSPSFISADHDHYLLPMKNTKVLNPKFRQMQQEVSLVPYGEAGQLVLIMIYDQTALMISKQEIISQSKVLVASLEDLQKAHGKLEAQTAIIEHQTNYDSLTGLPNRTLLKDRVVSEINRVQQSGEKLALIYVDLDRFKPINDNYGTPMGDALLIAVANMLQGLIKSTDTLARIAADEFVILKTQIHEMDQLAGFVESLLEAIAQPWELQQETLYISASVGVSLFPDDATDYDALLSCSDLAMEQAKKDVKSSYHFYTEGLNNQLKEILMLEAELKRAVVNSELEVFYQPKYFVPDLAEPKLVGAEALVRWAHPTMGRICPEQFIPIAERMGFISDITQWVFSEACQLQRTLIDEGHEIVISVNISPLDLEDDAFCDKIFETITRYDIPERLIELEITERMAISARASGYQQLKLLRSRGLVISLDDFGTGYSSLSYLAEMPVDILKIDKSFIDQYGLSEKHSAILKHIIELAEAFEMTTIAEGVETAEIVEVLTQFNCKLFQGFYFSRPLPASQFVKRCLDALCG